MPSFRIKDYTLTATLRRVRDDLFAWPERMIRMTSVPEAHGIVSTATFAFSRQFDRFTEPIAGHYTPPVGYSGIRVTGWFPLSEYTYYYDILRQENPVFVTYDLATEPRYLNYLTRLGLYTESEPIGEGEVDADARLASMNADVFSILTPEGHLKGVEPF